MWRHHPQAKRLVELLPRVGELRVVRAQFSFALDSLDPASNIRLSGELEGGALMDVGCYCVSAARLIAGRAGGGHRAGGLRRGRPALHRDAELRERRAGALRLRGRHRRSRRARGGRVRGRAAAARPLPLARAGDRGAGGGRLGRARRGRAGQPVRLRAARLRGCGRRRAVAAAGARRTPSGRRARSRRCTRAPEAARASGSSASMVVMQTASPPAGIASLASRYDPEVIDVPGGRARGAAARAGRPGLGRAALVPADARGAGAATTASPTRRSRPTPRPGGGSQRTCAAG